MLVILHGWSDSYSSFRDLAKRLANPPPDGIAADVADIHLGDYISLDDQVTFADLVAALDRAWDDRGLPRSPRSVDAIVHSTGGLVIRDWLRRFSASDRPVHRLLMLAPANFGSPLAHTGRSVIGRAVKGWKGTRLFETGAQILKGLELASSYSWELAERDLFNPDSPLGDGSLLCTVLVGNTGYSGIAAVANKPGSDGTVRVSTANLQAARMLVDFSQAAGTAPQIDYQEAPAQGLAFAVVDGEDHGSITAKGRGTRESVTWSLICGALMVPDSGFAAWRARLEQHTASVSAAASKRPGDHFSAYQNTVIRVLDNQGAAVTDYVIEFYFNNDRTRRDRRLTQGVQEQVISSVHVYSQAKHYRSLLINCDRLYALYERPDDRLYMSITACPELASNKVGYRTYGDDDIGALMLDANQARDLFRPHRSLLITLCLKRFQQDDVFRFKDV
ncbi:esterase/lipase family protein [Halopseudomonas pachastrellae]|uniref:esterase/lipase family protein n=1 Tax=Halopseudomonas pachastrellae TaxID=254161 RepID=UPI003D7E3660